LQVLLLLGHEFRKNLHLVRVQLRVDKLNWDGAGALRHLRSEALILPPHHLLSLVETRSLHRSNSLERVLRLWWLELLERLVLSVRREELKVLLPFESTCINLLLVVHGN
jgi:hypothetical protein